MRSYIDENYIQARLLNEYGLTGSAFAADDLPRRMAERRRPARSRQTDAFAGKAPMAVPPSIAQANILPTAVPQMAKAAAQPSLEALLEKTDAGFSETLLKLIDRTGKKDAEIYKRANIDRKLFSKIRSNPAYKPSKPTAVAFAIALELNLEETRDFIGRAGFALTHSSKFDIIVEYFILHRNYDVFELNEMLFAFDQPLIGA